MAIAIALIGSGIFAKEQHLPAIQACKTLDLQAIYSRSIKSARALGESLGSIDLYSDDSEGMNYSTLLRRADIKAVIIALPITNQPQYIRQALEAGKHVLSEKPIAADTRTAIELLKWYHEELNSETTWCVAENFRYLQSFQYAAEKVQDMGTILGFRVRVQSMVEAGGKYYETPWRKIPQYQGGFLLDGGVHFIAGTRLLLGQENAPSRITAFSAQLQPHLPPVDTVDALWLHESGSSGSFSGSFSISFGTSFSGSEYAVACKKGTVTVLRGVVIVVIDGREDRKEFADEGSGVKQEVSAWAKGLERKDMDERQRPEEALRDLQILEAMLRSGEQNGVPVDFSF